MQADIDGRNPSRRALLELVQYASGEPPLSEQEVRHLLDRVSQGDEDAGEELVGAHLRLVLDEAIRLRGDGVRTESLVRVGVRALARATAEPSNGEGSFPVHARRAVRRAMEQLLRAH